MSNSNPLDYDAKYPQKADSSVNEQAKIEVMKKNIGKEVLVKGRNENTAYAEIVAVFGGDSYIVKMKDGQSFCIKESALNFVEDIGTKLN